MPAKKLIPKEMILQAALKLLREQGYEAVNIRLLAKELGCSTQPIYLSFSGMDDLRRELVPLAVKEFELYLKTACGNAAINLYDMPYIRFAKEEPRLFCFLFMRPHAFAEIKQALLPMIECSIQDLMNTYHITHAEADILHDQLWMHAHGIAAMIATDFCTWDMEKVAAMLESCKHTFVKQYEA